MNLSSQVQFPKISKPSSPAQATLSPSNSTQRALPTSQSTICLKNFVIWAYKHLASCGACTLSRSIGLFSKRSSCQFTGIPSVTWKHQLISPIQMEDHICTRATTLSITMMIYLRNSCPSMKLSSKKTLNTIRLWRIGTKTKMILSPLTQTVKEGWLKMLRFVWFPCTELIILTCTDILK